MPILEKTVSIFKQQSHADNFYFEHPHYCDVIMSPMASQITSLTIVYSSVYSSTDQRKHQSSASLAFVWGIHRRPVNSPHKRPVTQKMFPFDHVIMLAKHMSSVMISPFTFQCHIYIHYIKHHQYCAYNLIKYHKNVKVGLIQNITLINHTDLRIWSWGVFQKHLCALKSKSS